MVLSGLAFSFTGMLQSLGEFRVPAAMSAVSNTIILIYYFFFLERFGVYGLALTFLIGWGAQGLIQIPFLIKHKFKFRFRFNLKDPGLRQIGKLALPVMVSTWVVPVNIAVNVRASGNAIDVPSSHFANTLFIIISGVFILSVSNVIFPKLSRQAAVKDEKAFGDTINETVRVLLFFLLPLTLGIMALSEPLVEFILGGNLFGPADIQNTGIALFFFAIGIVGFGLFAVLSRACYARMDGRTPIFAALAAIVVNAALSFILAPYMQVAGPALANAISQTTGAAILVAALTRKKILIWDRQTISQIARMIFCAAAMLVVVLICLRQMENFHVILQVILSAVVGVVVYLGLAALARVKEMKWAKENILKK
jgi:putative peptidoglycan lipid II flippase